MSSTPSIPEIIHEISHLDDHSIERWIVIGLTELTPQMLAESVREWRDPLVLAEYMNLENPVIKVVAKLILNKYWERVEYILTDPWELYNQIARDPEKKKILDTDRGRKWLTYVRTRCYDYYFDYTWN
ncbi:hypothetical protein KKF82_07055 [Patescibacteria group bacterium]|uniref:Uncharacterized protein n=1 Tax=viral metagenome TaxID=1070528 RepID=A0A6M3M5R3_9ZZZZ|nr:hypothetical protein [Patescibacteria group bacterium]